MWHFTKLALKSRVLTSLLAIAVAGASIWAFMGLKQELIPDISVPYTTIVTIYPQASAESVALDVSTPVENYVWDEWAGHGLKHVTSTSSAGMSLVMAEFEYGTDMESVVSSLSSGIGLLELPQAVTDLPLMAGGGFTNPQIIPINVNMLPLMSLSLSDDMAPEELRLIAETRILPLLVDIDGVMRVDVEGGDQDHIVIAPNPQKMNQYGVSMAQVMAFLGNEYHSLDEIKQTPLGVSGLTLLDVASVSQSPSPLSAITRTNGRPSVGISIFKTETGNAVEVSNAVNAALAGIETELGESVTVSTLFDQADFITDSINQLWEKAIVGAALAILVVFFFLWAVRASLITAISIPLSVLIAFLCMRLTGITLNLLTLSALTIAIGRLIDDSIVMVEVIFRRISLGENFREAAIGGAKEVATPITSATLATVAIFIPLVFVGGIVGEIFVPFALTVTFAMLASLAVSLGVIPVMSKWLRSAKPGKQAARDNWYQRLYSRGLKWTLGHRLSVVMLALIMLVGSAGLLPLVGTSFISGDMVEATISVNIVLPSTAELNETSALTAEVEALVGANPAVRSFHSTIGASASSIAGIMSAAQGGGGSNTASIVIYLQPEADILVETKAIKEACDGLSTSGIITVSSDPGSGMGFSASSLNLSIQGENQADLAAVTADIIARLQGIEGLEELKSDLTTVIPQLSIVLDPVKLMAAGLTPDEMGLLQQELVLLMNGGNLPGKTVELAGGTYPVYVKAIIQNLSSAEQAGALKIGLSGKLTLADLAEVAMLDLPSHISHTDTMLSATITGAITDKNVGAVNDLVQQQIDSLPPHPGVQVVMGGIAQEMDDTFTQMGIAIMVAIVIAFLIVVVTMRSFVNPLIIMISLPLAFIGSIPALLISGYTLGVSAMMGMLMLTGIVLTNAIVMVSMIEYQQKNGMDPEEALLVGTKARLRPILMTSLTTILAMVPMVVGVSSGTVLSAELAIVVIGGMTSSTLLTLFVIPAIYSLVNRRRKAPARA